MNCPICNYQGMAENSAICPECKSEIGLLNDINVISKTTKKNRTNFVLLFVLFICVIVIGLIVIHKQKSHVTNVQQTVEKLTQENLSLKNTIADMQKCAPDQMGQSGDTLKKPDKVTQTEYTVQKNDNLWIIAQKLYGDGFMYKKIADDNNIKKPYMVLIGTKLTINQ